MILVYLVFSNLFYLISCEYNVTVYTTQTYGGDRGIKFVDPLPTNPLMIVRKVIIRQSVGIYGLQFYISDGSTSYYTNLHGSTVGDLLTWDVPDGEAINRVRISFRDQIFGLKFFTDKGSSSPQFGSYLMVKGNNTLVDLNGSLVACNGQASYKVDAVQFVAYNLS